MIRRVPWLIAAWFALHAQQSFEAASVLPSKGDTPWSYAGGPGTNDPGQVTCKNVTLGDIILRAYDVQPYQLKNAPSWFDSERYTIVGLYDFSLDFAPPPGVRAPPLRRVSCFRASRLPIRRPASSRHSERSSACASKSSEGRLNS